MNPSLLDEIGCTAPFNWLELGNQRLAFKRCGKGIPVLCLHATGHGASDFDALAERLGHRFEIITVDWPGQGRSPKDGQPINAHHYSDLIAQIVSRLQLDRPVLLGNSIGGAAAILAAAKTPERFRGLVLCNAGGLAPIDWLARQFVKGMVAFYRAGTRQARWYPAAFRLYYRHLVLPGAPAAERRQHIVSAAIPLAPLLAEAWQSFALPESDLRAVAERLQLPVWLAWAREDRVVAWSRCREAARRIPRHRIDFFRGGHCAFIEDPDRFARGLSQFIDSLDSTDVIFDTPPGLTT